MKVQRSARASSIGCDTMKAHGVLPGLVVANSASGVGTPADVIAPGSAEKCRVLLDEFSGCFGYWRILPRKLVVRG